MDHTRDEITNNSCKLLHMDHRRDEITNNSCKLLRYWLQKELDHKQFLDKALTTAQKYTGQKKKKEKKKKSAASQTILSSITQNN